MYQRFKEWKKKKSHDRMLMISPENLSKSVNAAFEQMIEEHQLKHVEKSIGSTARVSWRYPSSALSSDLLEKGYRLVRSEGIKSKKAPFGFKLNNGYSFSTQLYQNPEGDQYLAVKLSSKNLREYLITIAMKSKNQFK